MTSSNLVTTNKIDITRNLNFRDKTTQDPYVNCVIASDAAKKLDFLILVIETLQINATESLFLTAENIGLPSNYSSRVEFWKIRCSNPFRNSYSFTSITSEQIDALVELISLLSDSLYPLIRQLLSSKESQTLNKERWFLFTSRLKSLIKERMNLQRSFICSLLNDSNNIFIRELLVILSLSSGPGGASRLKASLYNQN